MSEIQVTKLDAARRQLFAALQLYFEDGDPVAIHTLVTAAHEILTVLVKKKGRLTILDRAKALATPLFEKQLLESVRTPQNFFKHGAKDPNASIGFDTGYMEFFLFDACLAYGNTESIISGDPTDEPTRIRFAYLAWYFLHRPDMLVADTPLEKMIRAFEPYKNWSRRDYLAQVRLIRHDWSVSR
jgi:hypothetical protein